MTPAVIGGLLGGTTAAGALLVAAHVAAVRRPPLEARVLPYLRDLAPTGRSPVAARIPGPAGLVRSALGYAARLVDRVLGGAASVRRRLARAGLDLTVHDFRLMQVGWGLIGFAAMAAVVLLRSRGAVGGALPGMLACCAAFSAGVLLRDNHLTTQVRRRERAIIAEFPTIAELLALSVAAGEGPVAALGRVVARSDGALSRDLEEVLARIRTGDPVADAFDRLGTSTGVPAVARFAHGIAVAVERGTPLADVLHAQAADVREAGRRALIERAARQEVAMMVPVVFLILPVTVFFAFWPGFVGLTLATP